MILSKNTHPKIYFNYINSYYLTYPFYNIYLLYNILNPILI